MNAQEHWENIYRTKAVDAVSWYTPHLATSLTLIHRISNKRSSIIDVGAGASTLVDDLLSAGYQDLTAVDISEPALACSKKRLGHLASQVKWITSDITSTALPPKTYDIWHDRAVFHFLTSPEQRVAYVRNLLSAVKSGGHIIISTFAANGPVKCSGLDVVRYDAESLAKELGAQFRLLETSQEAHPTPFGATQNFLYCLFQSK